MRFGGIQSVHEPAQGSGAALIHELGLVLYIGAAVIFIVVMALVLIGVRGGQRRIDARLWVIGGGIAFPVVALSALLVYSLSIGNALELHAPDEALRIHVTGRQWWWEVRYEAPGGGPPITLANEIRVPVGREVELLLDTDDVIHSFWAPSLAGKVDMIPGRTNHLVLRADEAGVHRAQCAEYCGGQHANMGLYVIAQDEAEFAEWLAREAQSVSVDDGEARSAFALFLRGGCDECHAIRGTSATGELGPDLTHVGSRRSLAAGMYDNHIGTMAGWIAGAQDLKPGNAMPSLNVYSGRELRELSAWLGSLE